MKFLRAFGAFIFGSFALLLLFFVGISMKFIDMIGYENEPEPNCWMCGDLAHVYLCSQCGRSDEPVSE